MSATGSAADLVVRRARVATCDDEWSTLDSGGVAVVRGTLVAVAPDEELATWIGPSTEVVDAGGGILLPGLVNAHCHAGDVLFRGLVEGLPLEAWLEQVWRAERATLDEANTELGATLGYAECALGGVTTVMDMFWHSEANLRGARAVGLRLATGGIFFDGVGMDGIGPQERPRLAERFLCEHRNDPDVIGCVMPHGAYTVAPEGLRRAARIARRHDALLSLHAAETRAEQEIVGERYGRSVVRHLDELGLLGPRTVLAHGVHLDEVEIDLLAASGATVVHNPVSNLKLASGVAPVPRLLAAGVRVALGTDGAISGNDLDLWLALRLAAILHKGIGGDATAVSSRQALAMATRDGAAALGVGHLVGSLEAGKRADLVLLRADRAHSVPCFDLHDQLVFATGRGDVDSVWVDGREVVRGGTLRLCELTPLLAAVRGLQPRIAASIAEHGGTAAG
ncbi:MAG: amidohydrolase [Acidobacteria bacterium]|nr:MAG: amidohydrolase [Acidobacteriota bacterium]REK00996.1 MAG: amidohydrolase [Acidobacteriota bacterium]